MNVFTRDGGIDSANSQLIAVANVLTQHDLNARIVLQVKDLGMSEGSSAVRRSRVRLESLRAYLIARGVPEHALVLATRLSQSLPERVQIEFVEADG